MKALFRVKDIKVSVRNKVLWIWLLWQCVGVSYHGERRMDQEKFWLKTMLEV